MKKIGKAHRLNESEWMDAKQWHKVRQRQVCKIAGISDDVYKYTPRSQKDAPIMVALQNTVECDPIYKFFKLLNELRRQRHPWNHKKIHRIYCQMNAGQDFMNDALMCGKLLVPLMGWMILIASTCYGSSS